MEEVTKKDEILQRHLNEAITENRHLTEDLARATGDVSSMQQFTADYEKNLTMLNVRTLNSSYRQLYLK